MSAILIIEDDITFLTMIKAWLSRNGFKVDSASSISQGLKAIDNSQYDLILSDMRLPDGEGISIIDHLKKIDTPSPIIIMTSYADIQNAVNAMKRGAVDYIAKPINPEVLLEKINSALISSLQTKGTPTTYKKSFTQSPKLIEGNSEVAKRLYGYVSLVAPTSMSVLITGANGTGKEYVAHRIHQQSRRSNKPFIAIDCGALLKDLAASELFGHKKGAFTGATTDKVGAFCEANGGTIFLDEVGNLSYDIQVQLLRAIQERKIRPIGSTREIDIDVRIICATNKDLLKAISDGEFREDLFHRLNEFNLEMPLLCQRGNDIIIFAKLFLKQANEELERNIIGFSDEAINAMLKYSWPGNLRQMKNIIRRATLITQGDTISLNDLGSEFNNLSSPSMQLRNEESEHDLIIKALDACNNNKAQAARMLGIDRKTLYNKIKLHNL